MKVLFTGSTFPRRPDDQLPDFMWQQVRRIKDASPGVRAFVLVPHDACATRSEIWEGVEIRRFRYFYPAILQKLVYPAIWPNIQQKPWLVLQVPFLLLAEFLATVRWIRQERFNVVYSHWFMPQGVACGLAALLTGTPHVFTSHSSDVTVMRKIPIVGPWLVRFLVRRARAMTAVSSRSRIALESFFSAEEWSRIESKVAVIPMGIDWEQWREAADDAPGSTGADAGAPARLLFMGRLVEKKGVEYLLQALTLEPLRSLDVALTIAGDGPLLDALRARTAALGMTDRVHFRGYVGGAEKLACFRAADVVVVPSIVTAAGDAEGIPVVLLEALAAAKVCVATDASGAPDVVRAGEDALIVPEKDPAALATAIADALRLPSERQKEMSGRARRAVRRFDWETIAREHVRHLFPTA